MATEPRVLLVVPCFNEAERLRRDLFSEAVKQREWLDLLFVNDGSADSTGAVIDALALEHPGRVRSLHLARNLGKSGAVREGVLAALETGADLCGYWDADLASPIAEIDGMRDIFADPGVFLVMGVRVPLRGRDVRRRRARHLLGRFFAYMASLALDVALYDTQCGAKVFRNNDVARRIFRDPFTARWVFDIDLLARIAEHDRERGTNVLASGIIEHPLTAWHDVGGSRLRPRDFVRAGIDLATIAARVRAGLSGARR
jgi:glycosyltransferase involved in cell wall biosynthesis